MAVRYVVRARRRLEPERTAGSGWARILQSVTCEGMCEERTPIITSCHNINSYTFMITWSGMNTNYFLTRFW
jgi:hypothetical protein